MKTIGRNVSSLSCYTAPSLAEGQKEECEGFGEWSVKSLDLQNPIQNVLVVHNRETLNLLLIV